jgi:gamma-glutamylcyclotransferase (GGCT)/AIG2-like uncharacterized protein YtfP
MGGFNMRVLVYGTLKRGGRLNQNMRTFCDFIKPIDLKGYDMYNYNNWYPMCVEGEGTIRCELYETKRGVNELGYKQHLDAIEVGYYSKEVDLPDGKAIIYLVNPSSIRLDKLKKIESGVWDNSKSIPWVL